MEKRFILFFVLSFLIFYSTTWYVRKMTPPPPPRPAVTATATPGATPASPAITNASPTPAPAERPTAAPATPSIARAKAPKVELTTKLYDIVFSLQGGVPVSWDIIDPRFVVPPPGESKDIKAKDAKPAKLRESLIESDIALADQTSHPFETILRESRAEFYNEFNNRLYKAEKINSGRMEGYRFTSEPTATGLRMVKTYLFNPDDFTGKFLIVLVNEGKSILTFDNENTGLGLILGPGLGKADTSGVASRFKVDPVVKAGETINYTKPSKPGETMDVYSGTGAEWAGIQNMYFLSVLMPDAANPATNVRSVLDQSLVGNPLVPDEKALHLYPTIEIYGAPFSIAPGQTKQFTYEWFVGPKQRHILKAADHELTRVLFYDSWFWMRALCLGLMAALTWFHKVFGNWGVAIIVLTLVVRLITFPLVQKGMKSQAKMMAEQARLKPLMDKINEKFKDDPQRKQQEIFKLYKEHGVNPFGMFKGCAWMIVQMPIFIALYYLLYQSIDLRGAHFLWIEDLSRPDRLFVFKNAIPMLGREFNILPIIMAVTQVLTSKVSAQPSTDPQQQQMQRMMIYFMPIFMLFIFYSMPAGLVLYWLISNLWQVMQQLWVNKHMPKPPVASPPVASRAKA